MTQRQQKVRMLVAAMAVAASAVALTGCARLDRLGISTDVRPWVVADHDAKVRYHQGAGETLLNLDTTSGLAKLHAFQAVGYHHVESPNSAIHLEYETAAEGESYVSRRLTDVEGQSFDQSHVEGDSQTYYLLGDAIRRVASNGKSWVSVPRGDLGRQTNPDAVCQLFAVSYTCALIEAWNLTRNQLGTVPVQLSQSEDGSQHFATAVTYSALYEKELVPADYEQFMPSDGEPALIPLHLWMDENGLVTKVEANGVLTNDAGETFSVQIGFEVTAQDSTGALEPVDPADIPKNDLLELTTREQVMTFLDKLELV